MTPAYVFRPEVPERISSYLPEVKLILMLRDPVDRSYSHYQNQSRVPGQNDYSRYDFDELVSRELNRLPPNLFEMSWKNIYPDYARGSHFLARSLYYFQVRNWLKHFSRDQLTIIKSEELFDETADVLGEVCDFLDLSAPEKRSFKRYYSLDYPEMDEELEEILRDFFEPYNERLYELVGRDFGWD